MTTDTARREWLDGGLAFLGEQAALDFRRQRTAERFQQEFATEADSLTWQPVPDDGVINGPMSPVLMLQAVIEQMKLRPVVGFAFGGVLEYPDGPETATYSVLGVEIRTRTQHFRIHLLDTGLGAQPMFIDWLPQED